MTLTAVAVAAAFLSVPAKADPQAEPRAAMTELSHELVTCVAFFRISAIGVERAGDEG